MGKGKRLALGVALTLVGALVGCQGGVIRTSDSGSPPPRLDRGWTPPRLDQGGPGPDIYQPPADQGVGVDLPTQPLDPCLTGKCGADMLCIANLCHRTCDQPDPKCNDKVAGCGAGQACRPASSFSDACFPSEPAGSDCSSGQSCEGGTLCVNKGAGKGTICLKLCKYGCGGAQCVQTTNGCNVCYQ